MDLKSSGCFRKESKGQKRRDGEEEKGNCVNHEEAHSHVLRSTSVLNSQNQNRDACDHSCAPEGSVWKDSAKSKTHKITDATDFDWMKNTRIYLKIDEEQVWISITNIEFIYSYEFQWAKKRLWKTPLTNRCYIILAQAMGINYGGAPAGPTGTGKTETVKDLGRTLGVFLVVTGKAE